MRLSNQILLFMHENPAATPEFKIALLDAVPFEELNVITSVVFELSNLGSPIPGHVFVSCKH
jgi:hypothetical protein